MIMKDDTFFLILRWKQRIEEKCNLHRESFVIDKDQDPWLFFENKGRGKKTLIILEIVDAINHFVDCIGSIWTVGR